ncbi:TPA: tyrosine-type recombinase/integrase [Pseudomonas aeruginosa]
MEKDIRDIRSPQYERPISAATEKAYRQAREHFKSNGGLLPATEHMILNYIADLSTTYSFGTISHRMAALSHWHYGFGFQDPTKTSRVRQALSEAERICRVGGRSRPPLEFHNFDKIMSTHESVLQRAVSENKKEQLLRMYRDKAMFSLGFWRGFRSGDLNSLKIEQILITPAEGMVIYKDNAGQGTLLNIPAMEPHCPVQAMEQWLAVSGLTSGIVFPAISRWGTIDNTRQSNVNEALRKLTKQAEIDIDFTSHSLRVGFAEWAYNQGWGFMEIMNHVGWAPALAKLRYAR